MLLRSIVYLSFSLLETITIHYTKCSAVWKQGLMNASHLNQQTQSLHGSQYPAQDLGQNSKGTQTPVPVKKDFTAFIGAAEH